MTTPNTRGYWIRTIRGWGEDRLSDPQIAELDAVLTWYDDSAGERDEMKDENAKLREQLAEAVSALGVLNTQMENVVYSGFDPEQWGERMEAMNAANKVLAEWNKPIPC